MIAQWKRLGATEITGEWQGMRTTIYWSVTEHKWKATVDAAPGHVLCVNSQPSAQMRGAWTSHHAAMEAADAAMQRVIRRRMEEVQSARA